MLAADAGVGKSVIAATLLRRHPEIFVAHHFCLHTDATRRDPKIMLCTLAKQLAAKHAPFAEALEKQELSKDEIMSIRWNAKEVYDRVLGAPLAACADEQPPKVARARRRAQIRAVIRQVKGRVALVAVAAAITG